MFDQVISVIATGIAFTTPILLAAIGENFSERAGVIVLAVEGEILAAAFCSFIVVVFTGSYLLGALAGLTAAMIIAVVHAFASVTLCVDQIVSGIGLNMVAAAGTSFFFRRIFWGGEVVTSLPSFPVLDKISIPLLSDIPILGPILFHHNILTYAALLAVPLASFLLYRTNYGLAIRASGEDPDAVEATGMKASATRYWSVILGGFFSGLGGIALAMGETGIFMDGMSAGRGFLAVSAVIFGNWQPWRVMAGALLFGVISSLQTFFQALGVPVPHQLLQMLPYVVCVLALAAATQRAKVPASLGIPYRR